MTNHRDTTAGRPTRSPGPGASAGRRRGRPGTALVLIAGAMTLLMASAAWAVDLAACLQDRTHQQAAADAGALAGVQELAGPYTAAKGTAAKASAVDYVARNGYTITPNDVTIWDHPAGGKGITVHTTGDVTPYFGTFFGLGPYDVGAYGSAALGGVMGLGGTIPFGIPAYPDAAGKPNHFWVLGSIEPEVYVEVPPQNNAPNPTIQLKVNSGNSNKGNFLALSLDGRGANEYRDDIVNGCDRMVQVGDELDTQTGNMVGPTSQGILDRIAAGKPDVVVPLINKLEWDQNKGRSTVHVIGFLSVHLNPAQNGAVTATFITNVVSAQGVVGGGASPGLSAPVLILTP